MTENSKLTFKFLSGDAIDFISEGKKYIITTTSPKIQKWLDTPNHSGKKKQTKVNSDGLTYVVKAVRAELGLNYSKNDFSEFQKNIGSAKNTAPTNSVDYSQWNWSEDSASKLSQYCQRHGLEYKDILSNTSTPHGNETCVTVHGKTYTGYGSTKADATRKAVCAMAGAEFGYKDENEAPKKEEEVVFDVDKYNENPLAYFNTYYSQKYHKSPKFTYSTRRDHKETFFGCSLEGHDGPNFFEEGTSKAEARLGVVDQYFKEEVYRSLPAEDEYVDTQETSRDTKQDTLDTSYMVHNKRNGR